MSVEHGSNDAYTKAKEEAFEKHQKPFGYITYRGLSNLFDTKGATLSPWGYNDILPPLNGLKLEEWIERKVSQKGVIRLLDVGCGKGNYLDECKGRWGEGVECFGITSRVFCSDEQRRSRLSPEDILLGFKTRGIDVRVADAQTLNSEFPTERFDVITAVHLADYLADSWSLIDGMYSILEDRGVGFINEFPMRLTNAGDIVSLIKHLETSYGMEINKAHKVGDYYSLAFQKTKPGILLPLLPNHVEQTRNGDNVIMYKFSPESLSA